MSKTTSIGLIRVTCHGIIGTKVMVHTAYEPYEGHSTFTHIDGQRYGQVGTRPLPESLNKLKAYSDERYNAVKAWLAAEYERAYSLIIQAHPEAQNGHRDMGQIDVIA